MFLNNNVVKTILILPYRTTNPTKKTDSIVFIRMFMCLDNCFTQTIIVKLMSLKNIYFSCLIYGAKVRGLLNYVAESIIFIASITSFFVIIYQFGFDLTDETRHLLSVSRIYLLFAFFIGITLRYITHFQEVILEKMLYADISIYFLLFAVLSAKVFFKQTIEQSLPYLTFFSEPLFAYILLSLLSLIHLSRQAFTLIQSYINPSLLFLLSFLFVIMVGAGLFMLPNATTRPITFIDALFISTSSVCVTGLSTVDIAASFTPVGHLVMMILIQIGGIGVMTFTSFFALSFMGQSSFTSKIMLKDILNENRIGGLFQVILNILFVTLLIEAIGAYLIYIDIRGTMPGGVKQDLFFALFHSISAFCNAGIATLDGNLCNPLVAHRYNLHLYTALLVIAGGLGFPIVFNYLKLIRHLIANGIKMLFGWQKHYIHTPHIINIHTYIVVTSTFMLLAGGTLLYLYFEADNTLRALPWTGKLTEAFLGAALPRTAGFSIIDLEALAAPTRMMTLLFMMIGGGPMSTAGGIKVTTLFIAAATTFNAARNKEKIEIRHREIAPFIIRRAFAIISLYLIFISVSSWVLSFTEEGVALHRLVFEAASALSTAGFSLDLTPSLSPAGKIIIICAMLVGRIGALTFVMSFSKTYINKNYTYPQENILM